MSEPGRTKEDWDRIMAQDREYKRQIQQAVVDRGRIGEAKRLADSWVDGVRSVFGAKELEPEWMKRSGKPFTEYVDQALGVNRNDPAGAADLITVSWANEPDVKQGLEAFTRTALIEFMAARVKKAKR